MDDQKKLQATEENTESLEEYVKRLEHEIVDDAKRSSVILDRIFEKELPELPKMLEKAIVSVKEDELTADQINKLFKDAENGFIDLINIVSSFGIKLPENIVNDISSEFLRTLKQIQDFRNQIVDIYNTSQSGLTEVLDSFKSEHGLDLFEDYGSDTFHLQVLDSVIEKYINV